MQTWCIAGACAARLCESKAYLSELDLHDDNDLLLSHSLCVWRLPFAGDEEARRRS
jgi:hypothetical protein